MNVAEGTVKLSDGTTLKLRAIIIDIKETGSSPFGGVDFYVKVTAGISTREVPEEIRNAMASKPLAPPESPSNGWEIIDVVEYSPATVEEEYSSSIGKFLVRVVVEPVMASRNLNYRTPLNEPIYWLRWVYKISWKPIKEVI